MARPEPGEVLDAIYEAAAEPQLWSRALEKLSDRVDAAAIIAGLQEVKALFAATTRLDPDILKLFLTQYVDVKTNPTLEYYLRYPAGRPFDIISNVGKEKFVRTDFYNDLYRPQKLWPTAHALLFRDKQLIAPIGMALRQGRDPLSVSEVEELTFWFAHMARAMRVTARIVKQDWERQGLLATLDRLRSGVVLLGPGGKIALMNGAAEEILRAGDGLSVGEGRLFAARTGERSALSRLIAAACAPDKRGGGTVAVTRPSGAPPYGVEVVALSRQPDQAAAVVFISDPLWQPRSSVEHLVSLFGLTPGEARVALKVIDGVPVSEAAEQLGVTVNTLKTLLQRAFVKTDTRRQGELARLIRSTLADIRS